MSVMKHITNDDLASHPFLHSGGPIETLTFKIGEIHTHPAKPSIEMLTGAAISQTVF